MRAGEQIINSVTGEVLTMLVGEIESDGKYQRYEVLLPAHRVSPPLHYHTCFVESFAVEQGSLEFFTGKDRKLTKVGVGESIDVTAGTLHTFANASEYPCRMVVTTRPPGGIVDAFKLAYGIANGGGTADDGLPRNRILRMRFIQLNGGYLPRIPLFIQKTVFGVFKLISTVTGMEKEVDWHLQA